MIETALSVNGQDCSGVPGNTPEEFEAMAATMLRVAQAIREKANGTIKCLNRDGRALVSALLHNRSLAHNGGELDFPIIEELHCIDDPPDAAAFQTISESLIHHFRQVNTENR